MSIYDVVIIGAGLSGLQAARTLQQQSSSSSSSHPKIVIVEARNRVGGRALTTDVDGHPVDLGCSMIHGYYEGNPARELLKNLNLKVYIPYESTSDSKSLVLGDQGPLTESDQTLLFANSTQMAFKPPSNRLEITDSNLSVASLLFPSLKDHDERLIAIARTAEIGAGIELEKTSARWTGFENGVGGTDAFPRGGYSKVVENLVSDFKARGGELLLSQQIDSIQDTTVQGRPIVKLTCSNGQTYAAKYVISTIPLSILQKNPPIFSPPLSETFSGAVKRTLVGNLEKIVLSYSKPWWRKPRQTSSYLILPLSTCRYPPSESANAPPPSSLRELFERITIPIMNFETIGSPTSHSTLLCYIGANNAKHLSKFTDREEITQTLHDYLVERLSSEDVQQVTRPISSIVTNWTLDPFSLGATSTPISISSSSSSSNGESNPLDFIILGRSEWDGRLGFAGEHTDLDNHGSVCGALLSGKREGERVALKLEKEQREQQQQQQQNEKVK